MNTYGCNVVMAEWWNVTMTLIYQNNNKLMKDALKLSSGVYPLGSQTQKLRYKCL
jgi:hypothetical protein